MQTKRQALQQTYNEAMTKVENAALQIIADVAKERKANMVVAKAALLYMEDGLDVTAEVTQRLDAKLPTMPVELPKAGERRHAAAQPEAHSAGGARTEPWPIRASSPSPDPFTVAELAARTGAEIAGAGDAERVLTRCGAARDREPRHLAFLDNPQLSRCAARAPAPAPFSSVPTRRARERRRARRCC